MKKLCFIFMLLPSLCFADLTWEKVSMGQPGMSDSVYRASILHGWLVLYKNTRSTINQGSGSITFVPDEFHEWLLSNDKPNLSNAKTKF